MSFEVLHEQFCIEFQCFALRGSFLDYVQWDESLVCVKWPDRETFLFVSILFLEEYLG